MPDLLTDNTQGIQPLTSKQEDMVHMPTELWSDDFALKVAVQDFSKAEAYRTQNADWRWRTANELYQSWVTQKYWEGTKIPRASIGVFVAFEQIESMLPKNMGAIFADNPWMEAKPIGKTTADQAREWRDHLMDQMEDAHVREIFRLCSKDRFMYGNGIMKLSWSLREVEELMWLACMRQKPSTSGRPEYERILDKFTTKTIENKPQLEHVLLPDFYIDPNCASPVIQGNAGYVVQRKLVTVEDLAALRNLEPYKIPSDDVLLSWATQKPSTNGDQTKGSAELFRMGFWAPQLDQSIDPGRQLIEVLEYWREDRHVLVGNRAKALLNVPNSYGFIPFYDWFYADVPGRFYAMGVCDVVEGEQRLQSSTLNARLDELSLSIHRPMVKKLGVKTPTYALRSRPGQIWEAENPEKDYKFMEVQNVTQNAFTEVAASENRVQKTVGQADLYSTGTVGSGGNAAGRTATGIGAQVNAGTSRTQYIVENDEDNVIEPMLNHVVKLNRMFPPVGSDKLNTIAFSNIQVFMRASAKMQARMSLLQSFPLVFQSLTNPGFVSEMATQGVTPDWKELFTMLVDMTGYRNRADLMRPLTPQEQQMRNQPPAAELIKIQMQQERIQGQAAISQAQNQADMALQQQKIQLQAAHDHDIAALKMQFDKMVADTKSSAEREVQGVKNLFEQQKLTIEQSMEQQRLTLQKYVADQEAMIEREKIAVKDKEADNAVMADLVKALISAAAPGADGEGGSRTGVEGQTAALFRKVIQRVSGSDLPPKQFTIERDKNGDMTMVREVKPN